MKNYVLGYISGLIFFFHLFMSFVLCAEGLENALTFPLMHSMIAWVRSSDGEGPSDLSIGLLMYPTMIWNSMLWTVIIAGMIKLAEYLIWKFRRHKTG